MARCVCRALEIRLAVLWIKLSRACRARRRPRFWCDDRRTCSSKSLRESDRDSVEREVGLSGGRVAQSRYGAVRRYGQGGIDLAPVACAPGAFEYLAHVQKRAE